MNMKMTSFLPALLVGILMLLFSNHTAMQITLDGGNVRAADNMYGRGIAPFIGITSVSAFVMTITIIVLIMQGNKRVFYHERVSRMQSGMITFMAEVVENRDDNTGGHIRRTVEYVEWKLFSWTHIIVADKVLRRSEWQNSAVCG